MQHTDDLKTSACCTIDSIRRLPSDLRKNQVLYGECLGGALYIKDFERIAKRVGFADQRVVKSNKIEIQDKKIADLIGNILILLVVLNNTLVCLNPAARQPIMYQMIQKTKILTAVIVNSF